jgi:cyclophilin family peptidyl-prolyl cis-trans isomerase
MHAFNRYLKLVTAFLALAILAGGIISTTAFAAEKQRRLIGKNEKMAENPIVILNTSKGEIKIEVFQSEAPITSGNFLDLVNRGFYNGLSFHRYEPGFVIQGGDPKGNGTGGFIDPDTKRERTIKLEVKSDLKHDKAGMVAMARSNDPDSASCQFYITLAPATFLDMKYAVFGKVISGLDVVQQLRQGDKMTKVAEAAQTKQ